MKVIIEISEILFNAVKEACEDGFCGSDVWESVAAGVPYNLPNANEEITDKMFFIREENSNQPIAVVKVSDLMKFERPQGEWIKPIITLFNKYNVLLVHEGGQIVPVKNTTKQDCYDLLYEIQELIEWRKILFNKNLNDVYKEGEQNA